MRGHSEIVNRLIDSGANVNAFARDEVTPLKLAIKHGHMKIELTLKRYGARR
jgi:ankyrin repeat protein